MLLRSYPHADRVQPSVSGHAAQTQQVREKALPCGTPQDTIQLPKALQPSVTSSNMYGKELPRSTLSAAIKKQPKAVAYGVAQTHPKCQKAVVAARLHDGASWCCTPIAQGQTSYKMQAKEHLVG